ncbi:hypothetical protein CK203_018528 [Vitis vinifera]|uniref:Uncharacterized protein n=1 Tax=Vitis vinifera TaxID=29760 RepID=A0A438J671_VITVI|nr:hypothetical protein CK203_018528 [Vitis vinifera]
MDTNPFMWGQHLLGESWGVEGLDWSPISEESALRLDSPFTKKRFLRPFFSWIGTRLRGQMALLLRAELSIKALMPFHCSIPKKSLTKRISDFRPISLITSLYKIIAKVLSGRLGVLHETIHYTQGAFVQGRQILDAVLIANEIVDERRVSYAILVNGSAKGWVKASRGLRQGDPLSPFLFTLVADVNLGKSSIYGINIDQAHLSRLAEMLDCKASGWPILYLGLPLGGNPKACGFWDPVIERISSRLDGGKRPTYPSGEDNSYPILPYPFAMDWEGKRDHLVRWDVVCKPKAIGGLGFWEYFLEESRSSREMAVEIS